LEEIMKFVGFMRSAAGRLARIVAGLALILVGLFVVKGTAGIVMAVIGVVPLAAGIFNFCLFGPLFGVGFLGGRPKSPTT
jgi:hypothetical protein